jgi:hypothetical protein
VAHKSIHERLQKPVLPHGMMPVQWWVGRTGVTTTPTEGSTAQAGQQLRRLLLQQAGVKSRGIVSACTHSSCLWALKPPCWVQEHSGIVKSGGKSVVPEHIADNTGLLMLLGSRGAVPFMGLMATADSENRS